MNIVPANMFPMRMVDKIKVGNDYSWNEAITLYPQIIVFVTEKECYW